MEEREPIVAVTVTDQLTPSTPDKSYHSLTPPQKKILEIEKLTPAQLLFWRQLREKGEFVDAPSRRVQIGLAIDSLNKESPIEARFSHQQIASLFGIARSNLERQYLKYAQGQSQLVLHQYFQSLK